MCDFEFVRDVTPPVDDDAVAGWLEDQMGKGERPFLLAHTDDGVVWGRWDGNGLLTSHQVAAGTDSDGISPSLNGVIVQQAFVFGEQSEIRLFHNELGHWVAKEIGGGEGEDTLVESQLLVGDKVIKGWSQQGFTHLQDKIQQGLDQIVPIPITQKEIDDDKQRAHLKIYHFVTYDQESGEARIGLSRLVDVYCDNVEESA